MDHGRDGHPFRPRTTCAPSVGDRKARRRKGSGTLKLQIKIDGKTYEAEVEVLEEAREPAGIIRPTSRSYASPSRCRPPAPTRRQAPLKCTPRMRSNIAARSDRPGDQGERKAGAAGSAQRRDHGARSHEDGNQHHGAPRRKSEERECSGRRPVKAHRFWSNWSNGRMDGGLAA